MLKELANGEYVLMAKVSLKDRKEPLLLQRYITLFDSGPRLDVISPTIDDQGRTRDMKL